MKTLLIILSSIILSSYAFASEVSITTYPHSDIAGQANKKYITKYDIGFLFDKKLNEFTPRFATNITLSEVSTTGIIPTSGIYEIGCSYKITDNVYVDAEYNMWQAMNGVGNIETIKIKTGYRW
jgi:hypothetical protein